MPIFFKVISSRSWSPCALETSIINKSNDFRSRKCFIFWHLILFNLRNLKIWMPLLKPWIFHKKWTFMHFYFALIFWGFRSSLKIIIRRQITLFFWKDIQFWGFVEAITFGIWLFLLIIQVIKVLFLSYWMNICKIRTTNSKWCFVSFYSFSLKPRGPMIAGISFPGLCVLHLML